MFANDTASLQDFAPSDGSTTDRVETATAIDEKPCTCDASSSVVCARWYITGRRDFEGVA